jgi:hypothetical protein
VDLVERLGHHAVLSNPKQTKAIAAARLKNDRVDAERSRQGVHVAAEATASPRSGAPLPDRMALVTWLSAL